MRFPGLFLILFSIVCAIDNNILCDKASTFISADNAIEFYIKYYSTKKFINYDEWVNISYPIHPQEIDLLNSNGYDYNISYNYKSYHGQIHCDPLYTIRAMKECYVVET